MRRRPSQLPSWSEPQWQIDPLNLSTKASNSNSGTTRNAPLLDYAELLARWETTVPYLTPSGGVCNVNFMSGHLDTSDPIVCEPVSAPGTQFVLSCDLPAAGGIAGTLSGVVANSLATNQALNANLPAGTQAGSLIVNNTRGSIARAYGNISGNLWLITQPVVTPTASVLLTGGPTLDATWANTDSVTVYPPASNAASSSTAFNLHVLRFAPTVAGIAADFKNSPRAVNINFADLAPLMGFSFNMARLGTGGVQYEGCSFGRLFTLDADFVNYGGSLFVACDFAPGGCPQGGHPNVQEQMVACSWRNHTGVYPLGLVLDGGTVIIANESVRDIVPVSRLGLVYIDGAGTSRSLNVAASVGPSAVMATNFNGTQPVVYGSGGVDARCVIIYSGAPTTCFPCAAGLKLRGKTTAYAPSTSAGVTTWKQLALSASALGTAAPTGFGGYAVMPGVGGFWDGVSQP